MLAILLIPVLLIVLLLVPGVRLAVAWAITFVISPLFLRTRFRYADRPVITPDQRPWSPETALIPHKATALAELGFEHRGTWVFDKADGVSVVRAEIHAHEPTRTIAAIAQTAQGGATVWTLTELVRIAGSRRVAVIDHALDRQRMRPGEERIEAPSITRPEWMWQVIQALGSRHALSTGDPLPSSTEEWTEHLRREHALGLDRMRARGVITRPDGRGVSRFTIVACFRLTAEHLWPLKGRVHSAALARERTLLGDLGLGEMLVHASWSPEAAAREKSAALPAGGGIPDDRAVTRPIASGKALAGDDRRSDPRFAAVLSQSHNARLRHYRRAGTWVIVVTTMLMVAASAILRLPVGLMVLAALCASLLFTALLNVGRYHASERAAADALIRHGLCPSCLYALGGLTAEPDGCLVCPECGGAWNSSRVKEFTPFATKASEEGLVARARRARTAMAARGSGHMARDARGERRVLVSPLLENEIAASVGGEMGELGQRLKCAQTTLRKSGRISRWIWTVAVIALNIAPVVVLLFISTAFRSLLIPIAIGVSISLTMSLLVLRPLVGIRKRAVISTMLAQRLCPACADDLAGRTPDREGIVECTCGAAWRVAPPLAPAEVTPPTAPPPRSPAPSSSCTASSG